MGFNFLSVRLVKSAVQQIKIVIIGKNHGKTSMLKRMFETMTKMADPDLHPRIIIVGKLKDGIAELDDGANTLEEKLNHAGG